MYLGKGSSGLLEEGLGLPDILNLQPRLLGDQRVLGRVEHLNNMYGLLLLKPVKKQYTNTFIIIYLSLLIFRVTLGLGVRSNTLRPVVQSLTMCGNLGRF